MIDFKTLSIMFFRKGLHWDWFHPRIKSGDKLFGIMLNAARKGEP
ncbi:MAG TPA: hypothetical protein VFY72_03390 [Beijerinckiaceae bacterium]|nr:hypothetical protein [Beijerinckiaceae bacterium]